MRNIKTGYVPTELDSMHSGISSRSRLYDLFRQEVKEAKEWEACDPTLDDFAKHVPEKKRSLDFHSSEHYC